MQIIKRIEVTDRGGVTKEVPFYAVTESSIRFRTLGVHIIDSVTGETRMFTNQYDKDALLPCARKFKPYGFIDGVSRERGDSLFVVVDDASMDFLDVVDTVSIETIPVASQLGSFVSNISSSFVNGGAVAVDDAMSLFSVNLGGMTLCTLLQIMCARPLGWYGDDFYIYSTRTESYWNEKYEDYEHAYICYKVTFEDTEEAKHLMTKYRVLMRSPVQAVVSEANKHELR